MKNNYLHALLVAALAAGVTAGCSGQDTGKSQQVQGPQPSAESQHKLKVAYLDVGQGDSTLIISPSGKSILIDAGDNEHGQKVVDDVREMGISRIDWLVGTHPDADHVGGLDTVLQQLPVSHIVLPEKMNHTKTFSDVLKAIRSKGLSITDGKKGLAMDIGSSVSVDVISPDPARHYEDNNDWSVVMKVTYGNEKFLFIGDASKKAEEDMLTSSAVSVEANVYKAGHHGSKTSADMPFLELVHPEYAVISVGAHNRYHHPNIETLQRLHTVGVKKIYRTDDNGTITVETDGNTLQWQTEK